MAVHTSAGSKIFIGPVAGASVDTEAEYEVLSYVQVGEVEDIGAFGDAVNAVTFTSLSDRRVQKLKGSYDAGAFNVTMGLDGDDAGQEDLRDALASDADYAFKVVLNDGSTGSPSQDTTYYFRAKVMSFTTNIGGVENVTRAEASIAINSAIVTVERI